jgi:hypothetical protein
VKDEQNSDEEFVKKSTITEYSNEWFEFDTAATVHTTNRKDLLANPRPTAIKIKGHDGTKTKTAHWFGIYVVPRSQSPTVTC